MRSQVNKKHEYTCSDCLYFQPPPEARRQSRGNCTFHKEWIENAFLTTCSEMSLEKLKEKGIYRLVANGTNGWLYVRRQQKLRTRLFLIKS